MRFPCLISCISFLTIIYLLYFHYMQIKIQMFIKNNYHRFLGYNIYTIFQLYVNKDTNKLKCKYMYKYIPI